MPAMARHSSCWMLLPEIVGDMLRGFADDLDAANERSAQCFVGEKPVTVDACAERATMYSASASMCRRYSIGGEDIHRLLQNPRTDVGA